MAGSDHRDRSRSFQKKSQWRCCVISAPRLELYKPRQTDRCCCGKARNQMLEQDSLELLALKLPLPGN
jgi:hypothetical protein